MENIFQNRINRFNLLLAVYNATDASYDQAVNVYTLATNVGLSGAQCRKVLAYLLEEGLLRANENGGEFAANFTHKGTKAVEEVFIDQYQATYYFPAYREMRS